MKLTTKFGAAALSLSLFAGCQAMNNAADKTKSESNTAANSNSTAKNPGQGAPAYDPTSSMKVYTPFAGWPKDGAGLKQGWWVSQKMSGTGFTQESRWAVVAAAGDVMKLEMQGGQTPKDYILAETVKKTGEVSWAGVGKKGEKPKDLKVENTPTSTPPEAPAATDEDVTVKAGTFKSKKSVAKFPGGESVTWMGTDGDVKDVVLKNTMMGQAYELAEAPAMEDWTCSGKTYKVKHLKYTNGQEQWLLADAWPFVSVTAKSITSGTTIEITGMGEDAKPDLNWEGK